MQSLQYLRGVLLAQFFPRFSRQTALAGHLLDPVQRRDHRDDRAGTRSIIGDGLMKLPSRISPTGYAAQIRTVPFQ